MQQFLPLLLVTIVLVAASGPTEEDRQLEAAAAICEKKFRPRDDACAFWSCMSANMPGHYLAAQVAAKKCNLPIPRNTSNLKTGCGCNPAAVDAECCSPCTPNAFTPGQNRFLLYLTGQDGINDAPNEHYSEGGNRWSGISGHVCPSGAPPYSDCSSFVTWIYWTVFGVGPDFINGENWQSGWTGTMCQGGEDVGTSNLLTGDLCFYGTGPPFYHVTMYMSNGNCVSHGADPVQLLPCNYDPALNQCRRYYDI